ncbi:MAG: methyltransferase domain-containing protein [Candidatus Dormibacteraeota bacterium]|nr:methyltransferase domain-containing protein [Candidatus Dormibacteraeota bacterium]
MTPTHPSPAMTAAPRTAADPWNPSQYERFKSQREQPFHDLVAMLGVRNPPRVADLGCGTGALTAQLHRTVKARHTIGIDSSPTMLAQAGHHEKPGLRFVRADISTWSPDGRLDLIFSNAALQWIDDHPALFMHLTTLLAPNGVLAVQMPANFDHPSHTIAADVALEEPYASATGGHQRMSPVLTPEAYAHLLYDLGLRDLNVRLQVYCHELPSSADVVEWVRGTLLTDYQVRMPEAMFTSFVARYRERLLEVIGDHRPYLFAFRRILLRGRAASG